MRLRGGDRSYDRAKPSPQARPGSSAALRLSHVTTSRCHVTLTLPRHVAPVLPAPAGGTPISLFGTLHLGWEGEETKKILVIHVHCTGCRKATLPRPAALAALGKRNPLSLDCMFFGLRRISRPSGSCHSLDMEMHCIHLRCFLVFFFRLLDVF